MQRTTSVLADLHHEMRGTGPPLLFISRTSGDAGHFARTSERLADEFTTVAYDRRGCSRSIGPPRRRACRWGAQADDAAAVIEELELAPAIVFGPSGGGDILLDLIVRRPDVVRGAIVHEPALIALVAQTEAGDDELAAIVELAAADPRRAMEAVIRTATSHGMFESLDPELERPEAFAEELRLILRKFS